MIRRLLSLPIALLLVGVAFTPIAAYAQEQIGILQFDPGSSGTGNEFDVLNITGVNSGLGSNTTTTYVTNEIDLSDLSLSVPAAMHLTRHNVHPGFGRHLLEWLPGGFHRRDVGDADRNVRRNHSRSK